MKAPEMESLNGQILKIKENSSTKFQTSHVSFTNVVDLVAF